MATKFYLPSANTARQDPAWHTTWTDSTGYTAGKFRLTTHKPDTGLVTKSIVNSSVALEYHAAGMWISEPLIRQTIASGTVITGSISCSETNAKNNLSLRWVIRLLQNDGTTYRSDVVAFADDATEFNTSLRSIAFTNTLGGNVTVGEGDRLVIELGSGGDPASGGGSHGASIVIGEASAGVDLDYSDADTGTDNPWINFSQTLTFVNSNFFSFFNLRR